jgi:hypothetical protein
MGDVKIRYYVTRQRPSQTRWGYWEPCLARRSKISGKIEPTLMAQLGFRHVSCGPDGPHAWAIAESWNRKWDLAFQAYRAGVPLDPLSTRAYPPDSLGEAFARYRTTNTWGKKAPRTREGWERGWRYIEPVFADVDPRTVSLEDLDGWYAALLATTTVGEAYLAMKIWRALWRVVGTLKKAGGERYCESDKDPSLGIRRETPRKRSAIWVHDETRRLVKRAWRMGFKGLAAALAVSWDTQFSPVDVRSVTKAKLAPDAQGSIFSLSRAKTGKAAIGTLSYKTERILLAYMASLPFELHPDMPIFHTRGAGPGPKGGRPRAPAPYTKDTLAKDFRVVREAEFKGDKRTIMDFRRSGAVEATAGQADPSALAAKMANSIDSNRELQATYKPNHTAVVRLADEARARGRELMKGANGTGAKK